MNDYYQIVIKKDGKIVCTFSTKIFKEACEIEMIAYNLGFDVVWRF